ncbi:hypothetical protein ACLOJK_040822 [Asimina triloba]
MHNQKTLVIAFQKGFIFAVDVVSLCYAKAKRSAGSVLSGGGSVPAPKAPPQTWVKIVNDIQKGCLATRLGIPMIYGIDAVHGHNNVYNATIFPHNVGLGATRQAFSGDPQLVKRIGTATALEVRATGIPYVFAPCVAVCRDPRWGRCYESYSEDPRVVQAMTEIIPGLQGDIPANSPKGVPYVAGKKNVAACAKHFVGDGGTKKGINENNTIISEKGLLHLHMPPYFNSIIKGVSTVMVSYSSWNGEKMHANHDLVTDYLKNKLRFRGFVISDWEGIDRITSPPGANYSYSVYSGIHAGIDMIMVPYNYTVYIDDLTELVKSKAIPMSRIDDAVRRILRVKFMMGLFENPLADLSLVDQLGSQEHRELAREAVRKSLVLLKNGKSADKPMLPLSKKVPKILVAGSHADNLGYQCGGWTIQWQGQSGNDLTVGTTVLNAVKSAVDPSTKVVYSENPDPDFIKSKGFSYAIVVVGEHPYAETFGDSMNLTISDPGPSTIKNVCGSIKCVVIIISGRPVVIEPYVSTIDALVAAWLPGTEGQGITDVLFGDYGFSGKLPRTWFKSVDQLPMNFDDQHYDPLFPFGFGLTTKPSMARLASAGVVSKGGTVFSFMIEKQIVAFAIAGSVLSAGGSVPSPHATPEEWVNMVNEIQKASLSTRDPMLVKRIGAATALEVRATGIAYAFAPCIAVCRDPRWGRCYESFSEDTEIVKSMTESISGLQGDMPHDYPQGTPFVAGKNNVAACAKHYVGDGGTHDGINENNTIVDLQGLFKIHMPPYYPAIQKGVATIMISYSSWNGVKMHTNKQLITDVLKKKLRFRVMVGYSYEEFIKELTQLVEKGAIPMSRIDDAVKRILRVKFSMGLFEEPMGDVSLHNQVGSQEHKDLAREAVRKSLVLLKNGKSPDKPFLPLPKKATKILVAGAHADNLGYQCGGWTIAWQGFSGNNETCGTTVLRGIKATVDASTEVVYEEKPDGEFVVVGEHEYAETAGDNLNLTIADNGACTIDSVCASIPCVVVLISGRPLVIEHHLGNIEALVAAWLPGTEGQGIADVLFGDYAFTGKLARTWFKSVEQLPMNVGDRNYDPLFPFGFGLTTQTQTQTQPKDGPGGNCPYPQPSVGVQVGSSYAGSWSVHTGP